MFVSRIRVAASSTASRGDTHSTLRFMISSHRIAFSSRKGVAALAPPTVPIRAVSP
ncbi:MAG TPA: hypothetical protein VD838_19165 [Anaeromyxobacteraceae bacterium]|nr:hypothetical protein [Anaeromyxobacteraceae bacterium]